MSAELDLRGVHQPHEPDPAFVVALEQRLEAIVTGTTGDDTPAIEDVATIDVELQAPAHGPVPRHWWFRAGLGAAAVVVLLATLGVIARRDEPVSVGPAAAPRANGWVAHNFGNSIWLVQDAETHVPVEYPDGVGGFEVCPAFSPDGERLMLGRRDESAALEIFGVAADGATTPLKTIPLDGIDGVPCAIWSPDGRWAALGGGGAVWVVDTETAEVRRVPGYEPRDLEWRPGTDELAITGRAVPGSFVGDNAPIDVYTVSTGEVRTVGDVEAAELTWSPDGTTIAYTQAVPGASDMKAGITLIGADGTNPRSLTSDTYVADHGIGVVWSPQGDHIAYQRERATCDGAAPSPCYERSEVVLVTATSTDPANPIGTERVIPPLNEDLYGPPNLHREPWFVNSVTWSPDGTQLLYSAGFQGLLAVPIDAARPPIVLSTDGLTGVQDERSAAPWIPLQQWQRLP